MTTIRVKKDARYFSASNEPFNDKRLSWEARGLMGYLLSKPNDWEVRSADLENQGPAKCRKVKRMLAELRMYGYMNRIRTKLADGKFEWTTEVYESPSQNPNPTKGIIKTSDTKRTSAISTSAKQPDILSTDKQNTESSSKNVEIIKAANKKVDAYLQLAQSPGIKRQVRIDNILSYLAGRLKINTETKRWKEFAKYVDDRQQSYNERLDVFVDWMTGQKNFEIQFWPPSKMTEMWPQAFAIEVKEPVRLL